MLLEERTFADGKAPFSSVLPTIVAVRRRRHVFGIFGTFLKVLSAETEALFLAGNPRTLTFSTDKKNCPNPLQRKGNL